MRLTGVRIALRPRGPVEVVDLAVRFAQDGRGPLLALSAAVLLPVWLALSAAGVATGLGWVGALAIVALGPVLQAPFLVLGRRLLFAPTAPVRAVLADTLALVPSIAAGLARNVLLVLVGVVSLGVMWLPAQAALGFALETSALERGTLRQAFARSARLASDQPGRAGGGLVVVGLILAWCAVAGEGLGQLLVAFVAQAGTPFGSIADGIVTPYALAGLLAAQPAIALYRLLLYLDVRTVTEGWDLQVALRAAAEDA